MADIRLLRYAKTLINYSLGVQKGEQIVIQAYPVAMPLIEECYKEIVKVGGHPFVLMGHDLNEILLKEGNEDQLSFVSPISEEVVKTADKLLTIGGGYNTKYMSNIDPQIISTHNKSNRIIREIHDRRTGEGTLGWSLCMYPTNALAQEAGMSLGEYSEFIYEACLLNEEDPIKAWKKLSKSQEKITGYLNKKSQLRFIADDTDISMDIGGRKWINSDGKTNFPSGEVFSAPVENSVNGHIRFSFPGIYAGQEIEDIRLTFKDGIVVEARATKGEKLINALLETDEGSKRVGEVAIGTNYNITRFTKNMLFDEKIGGTIHLALGKAYPQTGGKNFSSIHWDMLCNMKNGGEIYADGELFYKDGEMKI